MANHVELAAGCFFRLPLVREYGASVCSRHAFPPEGVSSGSRTASATDLGPLDRSAESAMLCHLGTLNGTVGAGLPGKVYLSVQGGRGCLAIVQPLSVSGAVTCTTFSYSVTLVTE